MESEKQICVLAKNLTELLKSELNGSNLKIDFKVNGDLMSDKQHAQNALGELKETIERYMH